MSNPSNKLPDMITAVVSADSLRMNKGEEVILNKTGGRDLLKVQVGLGWDAPEKVEGYDVDIDASAFLINRDGRVRRDTDFVFYNNLETDNCIRHGGDSKAGSGQGDDEVIHVDLQAMPFDVERVVFSVTIHNAEERSQNFGHIKSAFIRIVNEAGGDELARFDLTEDASKDNAMIFGELVREGMGWKFKALGTGGTGGLYKIARDFGVNVAPG